MKAFNVAQILSNSESAFEDQLSVLNVRITSYRQDLMTLKQEQLEIYPLMAKVLLLESPELKNVTEIDVLQKQMKGQIAELNRQLLELKQQLDYKGSARMSCPKESSPLRQRRLRY